MCPAASLTELGLTTPYRGLLPGFSEITFGRASCQAAVGRAASLRDRGRDHHTHRLVGPTRPGDGVVGAGSSFVASATGVVAQLPRGARSGDIAALGTRTDVAGTTAPRLAGHPGIFGRALLSARQHRWGPHAQPLPIHTASALASFHAGNQQESGSGRSLCSNVHRALRAEWSRLTNLVQL